MPAPRRPKYPPPPFGLKYIQLSGQIVIDGTIILAPEDQLEYVMYYMEQADMGADSNGDRMFAIMEASSRFVSTGHYSDPDVWEVKAEIFEFCPPEMDFEPVLETSGV